MKQSQSRLYTRQYFLIINHISNSDRIMVTVICLIVMASLFSQITSTMPSSTETKAVDLFFFYFIIKLFTMCFFHTMLYLINRSQYSKDRAPFDDIQTVFEEDFQHSDEVLEQFFSQLQSFSDKQALEEEGDQPEN